MGADGGINDNLFLENTLKYSTLFKYNLHSLVRKNRQDPLVLGH